MFPLDRSFASPQKDHFLITEKQTLTVDNNNETIKSLR